MQLYSKYIKSVSERKTSDNHMSLFRRVLFLLFLLFTFYSCGHGQESVISEGLPAPEGTMSYKVLGKPQGDVIIVKDTIDLQNRACSIPEGYLLKVKGGYIKNGTLIGNKTRLKSSKACFNRVRILGTWNVPIIKSSLFDDLSYDNALKDVIALSDSSVNNRIYIGEGNYQVTAYKNRESCLTIYSNSEIIIDGVINLTPNGHRSYNVIEVSGKDVSIKGKGTIVGDKETHTGDSGEWGMGINILNSDRVSVSGLKIKSCWGDCVYIGSNSKKVIVSDCELDNGRRQGISVTSGDDIVIKNCTITNIKGTSPEYAIDIEPNRNETVGNVVIDDCKIFNCRGGITTSGRAEGSRIGSVALRKCDISQITFHAPLKFRKTDNVIIEGCNIDIEKIKFVFRFQEVKQAKVRNNEITTRRLLLEPCSNLTLNNNSIQCGGFYTEDDGKEHSNIKIFGNSFVKRIPSMGMPNKTLGIRIDKNKIAK